MKYATSLSLSRGIKVLAGAATLCLASQAYATPLITIGLQAAGVNTGFVTTVATDGGTGIASYGGAGSNYGYFIVNSISATGSPILAQGTLDTNAINVSSATGSTISIYVTAQGLTAPIGSTSFLSSFTANRFGGNATSVVETTLFSASNQLYTGTQMGTATFTAMGTSTSSAIFNLAPGGTYSETAVYVVTVGNGGGNVNDTINITASSAATPEPSSLIMLGTGLMSAAGMLVRRRKIS